MSKPAVVVNSDQKEIEQLKRKWTRVRNIGNGIATFGSTGFVGSMLSPFDFEGPVVEIATAALAVGGFIVKKVGEDRLAELEGASAEWTDADKQEISSIQRNIEETTKKRREQKALQKNAANQ